MERNIQRDLISGLIVGVIAIPLGMGFAIASGVKPEYGIYTTIIAGILISLLSGSRYQIGGPTGAFVPILFGIVMQYGYEKLLLAGFLAGILLILMGVCKLGSLIKYMPRPVTIGFTAGIAVTIFSGQISNFLGLSHLQKHESFLANMKEIATHLYTTNWYSTGTALLSLLVIILTNKFFPKLPGALLGLIVSSVVASCFYADQVATIGTAYGAIPGTLPHFHLLRLDWTSLTSLVQPALLIAFLGGIESLLTAVVADGMTNTKHNSNKELIGQGIANLITPLFGGIPATGAVARTATNIKSGATSRLSGVIHSLVVLVTLLLFAPLASDIPLASMAPVLMVVAWNMSEQHEFRHILSSKTSDSLVLVVTFLLTVLTSLTTAVEVGIVLAIVLFTKRMSGLLKVSQVSPVGENYNDSQIRMFTIEGPLFFGAAQAFASSIMKIIHDKPQFLLLRMELVPVIDMTGVSYLKDIVRDFQKQGGTVLLAEIALQPKELLRKTGLYDIIGEEHLFDHSDEALHFARTHIQEVRTDERNRWERGRLWT